MRCNVLSVATYPRAAGARSINKVHYECTLLIFGLVDPTRILVNRVYRNSPSFSLSLVAFIGILLLTLLMSCDRREPSSPVDLTDTLTLKTQWKYKLSLSGQYTIPRTGQRLIYSGDPTTTLTLRVFSEQGDSLYDVPLKEAVDALDDINSCTMFGDGEIFFIEEHSPRFAVLDQFGKLIRTGTLESTLCPTPEDLYEVNSYNSSIPCLNRTMYLSTSWWGVCGANGPDTSMTQHEFIQYFHQQNARKCRMAKLNLRGDSLDLHFGGCNILPHLADTPRYSMIGCERFLANHKLFLSTPSAPYILHVDTGTLEVLDRIPIEYVGGVAAITPPVLTEDDVKLGRMDVRSATQARIIGFAYDKSSKHYVVNVLHEVPEGLPEEETGINRPWSMIILDTTFKKLSEQAMPGKIFRPNHILTTDYGTYVRRASTGREDITGPKVFCRLLVP